MTDAEILGAISEIGQQKKAQYGGLLLLIVSIALFVSLGAFHWDLDFVLLLIVAVFVHELGHLAAMRAFRYKNLKMLFLPLIGGAASGEPDEQDACKIALISLMGPVAGIVGALAALFLWLLIRHDILVRFAYLSLFLSAFNLLPIMPLDGGHFINETLFDRYPKAELGFRLVAIFVLALLTAVTGSILLGAIAFIMLFTARITYRMAEATRRLRLIENLPGGGLDEEKVGQIRAEIVKANPYLANEKVAKDLPRIVHETWMRVNKRFASVAATALLLLAYTTVFVIFIPMAMFVVYGLTGQGPVSPSGNENQSAPQDPAERDNAGVVEGPFR